MVQAFTNAVGAYAKYTGLKARRMIVRENGDTVPWHDVYEDGELIAYSGKSETVRTNVRFIQGRPWRDPTRYSRSITNIHFHDGEYVLRIGGDSYIYQGCIIDRAYEYWQPETADPGFGSDEHNKCIVECLNKLGAGKVQLGQYLAESVKSADMLATRGLQLLELIRDLKHGRVPSDFVSKVARGIPDGYLEWKYGWKPLASDIHQLFNAAQEGLKLPQFISANRTVRSSKSGDHKPPGCKVASWKSTLVDSCKLWAKLSDEGIRAAQSYGLTNPLSLAWEIVPFSFVLDWFVPVGNVLQTLSDVQGLDFVGGYHSHSCTFNVDHESEMCGSGNLERFYFERIPYYGFPSGILPYANDRPFNTGRVQSCLALLNQLMRSR